MSERPEEMGERDIDERFASIIASWDTTAPPAPADALAQDPPPGDEPVPDAHSRPPEAPAPEPATQAPEHEPPPDATGTASPGGVNPSLFELGGASSWRVSLPPQGVPPVEGSTVPEQAAGGGEDEEHYEPPRVQLPPVEDLHFWGAVVGLVAGPLCLVYVAMARPYDSTRWFLGGLALSLVGFALLVLRQPRDRDHGDDGARV